MRSAFGIEHGDISKAKVQAARKVATYTPRINFGGREHAGKPRQIEGPKFGERVIREGPSKFQSGQLGLGLGLVGGTTAAELAFKPKKRKPQKKPVSKGWFGPGKKVVRYTGEVGAGRKETVHLITDVGTKREKDIAHNQKWAAKGHPFVHKPALAISAGVGAGLGATGTSVEQTHKKRARAKAAAARKARMNG